jgi:NAD(P)H-flavin reductase
MQLAQVFGAWTSALHTLASAKAGTPVNVRLEGPYGYDWADPACERLFMGGAHNSVAFVAGGVGIAPFSALIARLVETAPLALPSLKVRGCFRDVHTLIALATRQ